VRHVKVNVADFVIAGIVQEDFFRALYDVDRFDNEKREAGHSPRQAGPAWGRPDAGG